MDTLANHGTTTRGFGLLALLLTLSASACAAPFSDLQSARTLEPGDSEITGSYSYIRVANDGESDKVQDNFGVQYARGLSDRVELRAKYFYISPDGSDTDGVSAFGVGPKVSLVEDRVAFYTPVGLGFGGGIETGDSWQWQPTLLFSAPMGERAEVTASTKAQFWFEDFGDPNLAFNLGLGFGPDLESWMIRPEVGLLVNPGADGRFWSFSLGASTPLGR